MRSCRGLAGELEMAGKSIRFIQIVAPLKLLPTGSSNRRSRFLFLAFDRPGRRFGTALLSVTQPPNQQLPLDPFTDRTGSNAPTSSGSSNNDPQVLLHLVLIAKTYLLQ
eukprot:GHVT01070921.1.p1 GENE.GHVT01070921.1~~GHVT01070921.1.p1  ORF type:complete len:109 (+),score=7.75 GHVT01070921.1:844-1170(+)